MSQSIIREACFSHTWVGVKCNTEGGENSSITLIDILRASFRKEEDLEMISKINSATF